MEAPPCRQEEESQQEQSSAPVIGIGSCDSAPLLWRLQDSKAVRSNGSVGASLGSSPRTPRQNVRSGRPSSSSPEEERSSGERHGAAASPARNQGAAGGALWQRYEEEQQRSFEEQSVLALEDRKSASVRAMTSSSGGSDEASQRRSSASEQNFTFPRSASAVQSSTARAGLSHCEESRAFSKADWPIREQDLPRRHARYQVFRDSRGRGFFSTSAGKFGGDFSVYPGDPSRFHAHFIAVCVTSDESICMSDILSVARSGSNVKKTVSSCSPAPDGPVRYTSVQWSGMV